MKAKCFLVGSRLILPLTLSVLTFKVDNYANLSKLKDYCNSRKSGLSVMIELTTVLFSCHSSLVLYFKDKSVLSDTRPQDESIPL